MSVTAKQERMDRRVRSGEILVGRERENRFDSLATDNGVLFGQLSVGSGLELRNDNYVYQRIADCYVCPGYTVIPKLRRNGLKGSFADIAPQKLMKPCYRTAEWRQYLKVDANETSSTSSTTRRIWISVGRPTKSCYARSIG